MEAERISHYRILEKLGAGGMGEVYLAEDTKLGRKVALKLLAEEFTTDRDRLNRFEQEAAAASALNHPNILTIHELGVEDGRHFIATEFIDGVTLRQKIADSAMEMVEILDISIQVASALEEAHGAGIVHRDIKPENIMVRRNGYVKVLDFGLAKLTEKVIDRTPTDGEAATKVLVQTDAGVVMGTSHYMSPEQTRGYKVDARTDIWSFGIVMYELIAGRVPFQGETPTDVIVVINQKDPLPLARFAAHMPAELDWIVTKSLRRDKDERYQTVKELLTDLRRVKQRLEFEAQLERSIAPDQLITPTTGGSPVMKPTVIEKAPVTGAVTAAPSGSSAEYIVSEIRRHKKGAGVIAGIFVVLVVGAVFLYHSRKTTALTERDTVLIADFVNTTGEPVFDGTLKQALAVQLGQSPFLNIFPDERVREALKFMGRSPDERVTRDVAREISERQGIKAMIVGSVASLGSHYVITLEALNAHTGDTIAREQIEAESKEKVLAALGQTASHLREKLGESLNSIKKFDVAVEQATTSSLEALKNFTQGTEEFHGGDQKKGEAFFKRAIELDPNFAMAYARLSVGYSNTDQLELAEPYAQKAFDLRDRVSERERFYISEKYYSYVTGELDKAIGVLESWAHTYPNDYVPHNNLAVNYGVVGRAEEALREAKEAVRLDPKGLNPKTVTIECFVRLNRYDEAQQLADELRQQNPDATVSHSITYGIASLRGDQAAVDREIQWFKGKSSEHELLGMQSDAQVFAGRLHQLAESTARRVDQLAKEDRKENASQLWLGLASTQAIFGECDRARQSVASGLPLSRGRQELGVAALNFALCNEAGQAQAILDEATRRFPKNTAINSIMVPLVRSLLEMNRGNNQQALDALEPVRSYELGSLAGFWVNYIRGQVYLKQHAGADAAREFQKILDHRGADVSSPLYSLAHLWLARAAALSNDASRSRKEYQDFLALWKDADADLPILIAAKKEYELVK
jgi:serine/threonine protein kinase/tetratricopeptide (TPR) repeat protein